MQFTRKILVMLAVATAVVSLGACEANAGLFGGCRGGSCGPRPGLFGWRARAQYRQAVQVQAPGFQYRQSFRASVPAVPAAGFFQSAVPGCATGACPTPQANGPVAPAPPAPAAPSPAPPAASAASPARQVTPVSQPSQPFSPFYQPAEPVRTIDTDPYGFLAWLNGVRAMYGLSSLAYDPNLAAWASANNYYQALAGVSSHHVNPNCYQVAFYGPWNAIDAGIGWLNSPSHASVLLSPAITAIGIAGSGNSWTANAR